MDEIRASYLFDLANLCSTPPPLVDALRFLDFIQLVLGIEDYKEREAKRWQFDASS